MRAPKDERELLAGSARGSGMRIVGPNCMGFNEHPSIHSPERHLRSGGPDRGARWLLVSIGSAGNRRHRPDPGARARDVDIHLRRQQSRYSGNDLLQYWEHDDDTDVILLYLESFGNPRKFPRIARRVSRHKPIVAVKSGRSKAGARAAASHTASLAAGDVAVAALFHRQVSSGPTRSKKSSSM